MSLRISCRLYDVNLRIMKETHYLENVLQTYTKLSVFTTERNKFERKKNNRYDI